MFENRQDTSLLRDSLISASNYLKDLYKSKAIISTIDEDVAVQMVVSTVSSLSSNLYGINTFQELFQKQQDTKQRCHAVMLINLLKSEDIVCSEASNFYQGVLYDVNNLSWSYYLKLNFSCHWSEYFIECAHQLQPNVLAIVLKKLLEVQCDSELKFYSCHLALQAFLRKIFDLCSSFIEKEKTGVKFAFNFCVPKSLSEENTKPEGSILKNSPYGPLSSVFDIIMKQLTEKTIHEADINFIKVVFHAFKTIFKFASNVSAQEEAGNCIEKLNQLTTLLVQCLTQETMISAILESMEKPFYCLIDSGYQTMSWEINNVYLVFLLQNLWKDFKTKPNTTNPDSNMLLKTASGYQSDLCVFMKQNGISYDILINLNEKYLNSCSKNRDNYFLLLTVIVKHHYPYASRAAECFLLNPELWKQYHVISLLEENVHILNSELHVALADAIVKANTTDMHDRLLNIFYKVLSQASPEIYNLTLENILKTWGFCDFFMSSDFESQLTHLARKTMSLKEVEEYLLPLFVQSPKVVLQFLIEQAMMQGIDGMDALKVLKTIPVACLYECPEEPVAPLITILAPYFEHSLRANEAKHFLVLLKTLMEIQVTEDILCFDLFLDKCIFPNSIVDNLDQLGFTFECLFAALDVLINNHALEISGEKFISLLKHLGSVLSFCIKNGHGKLKDTVVDIMELLSKYKKRPQLDSLFNDENNSEDIVKLYIIGIFLKERNIEQQIECDLLKWKNSVIRENFQYLWIWCCLTCNTEDFVDNIPVYELSYMNLLKHLPSILWHLTKSEWLQAAKLIMYYQHILKLGVLDYPWLLPDNDPELYGVIRCLMDSFTLMMKQKSSRDILYCSSCLTNTIMGLLNKTTIPPSLFVNVFLDICCVSSYVDSEAFFMFSSVLMSLQKQYLSVCDKTNKKDCITLMKLGLDNIQNDTVDKASLKDKLCQV